jgi:hypothetical protein
MSKVKTGGDPEGREQKEAVDIVNIASLTAEKLFRLAAQLEVRSAKQRNTAPRYAGSYPRFE